MGKRHGLFERRFADGRPHYRVSYHHGVLHGMWIRYYESGAIESQGMYRDGLKEGTWRGFYSDGNPHSEGGYSRGERHGRYVTWARNGAVEVDGHYEHGQQHGTWIGHGPSGVKRTLYSHGKPVRSERRDAEGSLVSVYEYTDGELANHTPRERSPLVRWHVNAALGSAWGTSGRTESARLRALLQSGTLLANPSRSFHSGNIWAVGWEYEHAQFFPRGGEAKQISHAAGPTFRLGHAWELGYFADARPDFTSYIRVAPLLIWNGRAQDVGVRAGVGLTAFGLTPAAWELFLSSESYDVLPKSACVLLSLLNHAELTWTASQQGNVRETHSFGFQLGFAM